MNTKSVKPTFGISFGLPHQGGGGYPINLHGPNPLVNPYGGSVGSAGINLGLVSVNPLVSVQIEKDDYGQKVVKPFVNLHVTPNDYLVHKLEDLLTYKKDVIYNKHQHFHQHHGPYKYHHYHHKPHHFHGPPKPHFINKPLYHSPPPIIADPEPDLPQEYPSPIGTTYFDDPLNYGGGFYDDGSLIYGRESNLNDESQNNYDDAAASHTISRRGKSFPGTSSNPVRFPTSRKRRDVTDTFTPKPTKVRRIKHDQTIVECT